MSRKLASKEQINQAREEYACDEIAIDVNASVSIGVCDGESTTWVQAWVLLSKPE